MFITEQEFFDYLRCPAYYDMKHNKKIAIEEGISVSKLLSKISNFFYLSMLNGTIPSMAVLKNKWDSICTKYEKMLDSKQILQGMGLIFQLVRWAEEERPVVLDVNTRYQVRFGEYEVTGNLATILKTKQDGYELLITNFSNRLPDQTIVDMNLSYTLQAYGFKSVYNKDLQGIRIRSVKHARDFYTSRTEQDFKRLETTVKNAGKSIQEQLFYPREYICQNCPAKIYCKYWC